LKNKQAILVNDISTIIINGFLPAFWQLMNTPSVKLGGLGLEKVSECIFDMVTISEIFSLKEVIQSPEKIIIRGC
jgi:hypothetical protein